MPAVMAHFAQFGGAFARKVPRSSLYPHGLTVPTGRQTFPLMIGAGRLGATRMDAGSRDFIANAVASIRGGCESSHDVKPHRPKEMPPWIATGSGGFHQSR